MHRSLLAAILLSIASIGVSQIPIPNPGPPPPCVPSEACGNAADRIVIYHESFPLYWYTESGLIFLAIGMAGELKRVIRQDDEAKEEISLA